MESIQTLIVDDEEGIRFFLEQTLRTAGYAVTTAASGEEALMQLRETFFEIVILDLKLGGRVDGLRILETIKWRWPETAVIMLTAHGSLESALAAIREGVDGYLLKPAEPSEIRQVVREVLSRKQRTLPTRADQDQGDVLQKGTLVVDLERHVVTRDEQELDLTPSEFKLLVYLMENAPRVASPQELVRVVQGYDCSDEREAREIIKWHIHRLRRKVELDPADPQYVLNVWGVGYRFGPDEQDTVT